MSARRLDFVRVVTAGAGGTAIAVAFPPSSLWPASFIGVSLILTAVAGVGVRFALMLGMTAGIAGHALAFTWLWPVSSRFTQASVSMTGVYVALFVLYHSIQLALFAAAAARQRGSAVIARSAETAAAWVILEWCYPKIFPWSLADGLGSSAVFRQAVDIAGPYGLSFIVVAAGALLVTAFDGRVAAPDRLRAIITAALGMTALAVYGAVRLSQFAHKPSVPPLRVTLIQGGIGLHADPLTETELAWSTYGRLTLAAAGDSGAGLVIWPETILRKYVRHDEAELLRLRRLVSRLAQPLLFGTLDLPAAGDGELNVAMLMLEGDDHPVQTYEKMWLLPFAEYVPGARVFSSLKAWRTTGDFVPGVAGGALELGSGARIAPAICFEALRPGAFNRLVRTGADLLVNLSDDNWFAGTVEPLQHLQSAALRAVETRRWLVRSSDSGISAVIDPTGRVVKQLDVGAVGSIQADVPLENGRTLYVWLGDWAMPFCFALAARLRRVDRLARLSRTIAIRRQVRGRWARWRWRARSWDRAPGPAGSKLPGRGAPVRQPPATSELP